MNVHIVDNYFVNPTNPIKVNVIGAGGTGSQVITALGRMSHSLLELGHPGLQVNLWDDDEVTQANLGRQLFAQSELGRNKAVVLINRMNRFFGTNWKAIPLRFDRSVKTKLAAANLFISCVDTVDARQQIAEILRKLAEKKEGHRDQPYYWMDFGNSQHSGQVILSTVKAIKQPESSQFNTVGQLPFVTDEYGDLLIKSGEEDTTPSCSLAEALTKQDLFINSTLANLGCALLWSMFRTGMTENRGFFLNLKNFRSQPVTV